MHQMKKSMYDWLNRILWLDEHLILALAPRVGGFRFFLQYILFLEFQDASSEPTLIERRLKKNFSPYKNPLQAFWLDTSNKHYLQDIIGVGTVC